MDYAGEKNLFKYMRSTGGSLSSSQAEAFQRQIVTGVAHCHANGVAHRDLKPENIVINESVTPMVVKIVDFGCAINLEQQCTDVVGTMPFISPEVMRLHRQEVYQPSGVDMWACGVILLEMLFGVGILVKLLGVQQPSKADGRVADRIEIVFSDPSAVQRGLSAKIGAIVPNGAWEMIFGLLTSHPERRWSARRAQSSEWLSGSPLS